jgi:hypothetical protein
MYMFPDYVVPSLLGTSVRELGLGCRSLASELARRISEIGGVVFDQTTSGTHVQFAAN